jgi:AcrR family transcriptional regulator
MFCMDEADAVHSPPGGPPADQAAGPSAGPTTARRGRTRSADVERELLVAAETVLVRDGPGGLTVRAVATEAAIAPMGVYNRLGGKEGLVDALLIKGFDRLRASVDGSADPEGGSDMRARFYDCGRRYREFALASPHFYAIMFEDAILHESDSQEVRDHAEAAFQALVHVVELAAAAGVIAAPNPVEAAQQIWSAVHGAVALELKDLIQTENPAATFHATLDTLMRGLAPH